jgi:hypothetical protein
MTFLDVVDSRSGNVLCWRCGWTDGWTCNESNKRSWRHRQVCFFVVVLMSRKFAVNLKIPFFTPEEYFLGDPPTAYILGAFNPLDYIPTPVLPSTEPTATTITTTTQTNTIPPTVPVISPSSAPDIILFVGSPAAGKSTFYRDHLLPMGYARINQDTLKTRDRCVAEASTLLSQNTPIVIGLHSLKQSDN